MSDMSGATYAGDVETDSVPFEMDANTDESELTVGYYDGFIWYHEDDLKEAYNFLQSVRDIELKNKKKVKIAMYDGEEFVSLGGSEFQRLDKTFERCTFCFIFLSKTFIKDKWSKLIADSLLMKTIYSDEKQWCVLPVITAPRAKLGFEIPLGLNALREVKFFTENRQFIPCLQALFNDRVHEREMKERKNQNKLAFQQERRLSKSIAACNIKDGERKPISTSTILQEPNAHNDLEVDGVQDKADLPIANDIQIVQPVKTNAKGCFQKKVDDTDHMRNVRLIAEASKSVGFISGPGYSGTGFRVGSKYLATARHVIVDIAGNGSEIDEQKLRLKDRYVQFEYLRPNENPHDVTKNVFYFQRVIYESKRLDTTILEMKSEGEEFPPPIPMISGLKEKNSVYIISHNKGLPQTLDPKIEFYKLNPDDVPNSLEWARKMGIHIEREYENIEDTSKVLFHCISSKGASGALGVMIDQELNVPQGVLMLLRGYPDFLYGNQSFSDEDKSNFLIVEQGVLLSSVYSDMNSKEEFKYIVDDINFSLKTHETV